MDSIHKLVEVYSKNSKHSNYQVLPARIKAMVGNAGLHTRSRHEAERLRYVLSKVSVKGRTVLDIGGNTGYFTFELLDAGAEATVHYEGNKEHSDFVKLAAHASGLADKIKTVNSYFVFDGHYSGHYDIILLFNVLHHVGDDYGEKNLPVEAAKSEIIRQLNSLSKNCDILVFQMGFNWQGNIKKPLFEHGTKKEMIDFVTAGTKNDWNIVSIGVPQRIDGTIVYEELNDKNIQRDDSLGEFLNRPIFILKAKGK